MGKDTVFRKGFVVAMLLVLLGISVVPSSFGKIGFTFSRSDSSDIPPKMEWEALFSLHPFCKGTWVEQTADGGYIITGSTRNDALLLKTDMDGTVVWNNTYHVYEECIGSCVQQTADGGYLIIGSTVEPHGSYNNSLLIKTDAVGVEQWSRLFGGAEMDRFFSGQQTNDSGFVLAGDSMSFGSMSDPEIWIVKTDGSGNEQWNKTYGNGSASSIQQTADNGYIIAGSVFPSATASDFFLLKTDFYGTVEWMKTFGGPNADYGYSVQQTSDLGFVLFGSSYQGEQPDVHSAAVLIRTDPQGNMVWNRTFVRGTSYDIHGYCVRQTNDHGFILTGTLASVSIPGWYNLWLLRTDSNGTTVWERIFDSGNMYGDVGNAVQQTADNGYIVVGNQGDEGREAVWVLKIAAESPVKMTGILGKISDRTVYENYSVVHAYRTVCVQLFPLKIRLFHSGEELVISNMYRGFLSNTTIVGVFRAHI